MHITGSGVPCLNASGRQGIPFSPLKFKLAENASFFHYILFTFIFFQVNKMVSLYKGLSENPLSRLDFHNSGMSI